MIAYIFADVIMRTEGNNTEVGVFMQVLRECHDETVARVKFQSIFSRSKACQEGWCMGEVVTQIDINEEVHREWKKYLGVDSSNKVYVFADVILRQRPDGVKEADVFLASLCDYKNEEDAYDEFIGSLDKLEKTKEGWFFAGSPVFISINSAYHRLIGDSIHVAEVVPLFRK